MKVLLIYVIGAVCATVFLYSSIKSVARKPAEWVVSKGYTPENRMVPGVMVATTKSSDVYQSWLGDQRGELSVRCSGHSLGVFINPNSSLEPEAGTDDYEVSYGFDASPRVGSKAKQSGRILYIGGADLVRQFLSADQFSFGFTPLKGKPSVLDFDLREFKAATTPLRQTCTNSGI